MKVKNFAFYGIMASILGIGGAYAAESSTVIASKAYVDAKTAGKQNTLNNTNLYVDPAHATGNVVTGITANNGTVTYQMGNVDTSGLQAELGSSNVVVDPDTASGNAVTSVTAADGVITVTKGSFLTEHQSLSGLQAELGSSNVVVDSNNSSGNAVTAVTAADGVITVTKGSTFALSDHNHDGVYASSGHNHDEVYEKLANRMTQEMLNDGEGHLVTLQEYINLHWPHADTDQGEAEQLAAFLKKYYPDLGVLKDAVGDAVKVAKQGSYEKGWGSNSENAERDTTAGSNFSTALRSKDTYVPTMSAVEKRIADITHPIDNKQTIDNVEKTSVADFTQNTDTHAPSIAAVKNALSGKATAGSVTATSTNSVVTYNAQGIVTGGTAAGALATLDTGNLGDINNTTQECSTSVPCVFSFDGTSFKWTKMDMGS